MAFTPIESQEKLDEIITARLERQKNALRTEWKVDELSTAAQNAKDLQTKLDTANEQVKTLTAEKTKAERIKTQKEAAKEAGIPEALAERLTGKDKDEMIADAKELAKSLPKQHYPARSVEGKSGNDRNAAWREVLNMWE